MYYGNIKWFSIENGPGVRISLFVSGCRNHCKNCFSQQTWAFDYGEPFTAEIEDKIVSELHPEYIDGITILGGEPFEPENQKELLPFLQKLRSEVPNKSIWMFSGFTYEELNTEGNRGNTEYLPEILSLIDVMVDGRFVEEKKNIRLRFRGSENQRIIDMKKTLAGGCVVTIDEYMEERERLN